ncbi:MAG: zinc ribbon domain-containing protein, partial [Endomicrobiales bacterium]
YDYVKKDANGAYYRLYVPEAIAARMEADRKNFGVLVPNAAVAGIDDTFAYLNVEDVVGNTRYTVTEEADGKILVTDNNTRQTYIYEAGDRVVNRKNSLDAQGAAGLVWSLMPDPATAGYEDLGNGVYRKRIEQNGTVVYDYVKKIGSSYYRFHMSSAIKTLLSGHQNGVGALLPDLAFVNDTDATFKAEDFPDPRSISGQKGLVLEIGSRGEVKVTYNRRHYLFEAGRQVLTREAQIDQANRLGLVWALVPNPGEAGYEDLGNGVYRKKIEQNGTVVYDYIKKIDNDYYRVRTPKNLQGDLEQARKRYGILVPDLRTARPEDLFDYYSAESLSGKPGITVTTGANGEIFVTYRGRNFLYEAGDLVIARENALKSAGKAGLSWAFVPDVTDPANGYENRGNGVYRKYLRTDAQGRKVYDFVVRKQDGYYRMHYPGNLEAALENDRNELGTLTPDLASAGVDEMFDYYSPRDLSGRAGVKVTIGDNDEVIVTYNGQTFVYEAGKAVIDRQNDLKANNMAGLVWAFVPDLSDPANGYQDLGNGVYRKFTGPDREGNKVYDYVKKIGNNYYRMYMPDSIKTLLEGYRKAYGVLAIDLAGVTDPSEAFSAQDFPDPTSISGKRGVQITLQPVEAEGRTENIVHVRYGGRQYIFEAGALVTGRKAQLDADGEAGLAWTLMPDLAASGYEPVGDPKYGIYRMPVNQEDRGIVDRVLNFFGFGEPAGSQEEGRVFDYVKQINGQYYTIYLSADVRKELGMIDGSGNEVKDWTVPGLGIMQTDLKTITDPNGEYAIFRIENFDFNRSGVSVQLDADGKTIIVKDNGKQYILEVGKDIRDREASIQGNKVGLVRTFLGRDDFGPNGYTRIFKDGKATGVYVRENADGTRDYVRAFTGSDGVTRYYRKHAGDLAAEEAALAGFGLVSPDIQSMDEKTIYDFFSADELDQKAGVRTSVEQGTTAAGAKYDIVVVEYNGVRYTFEAGKALEARIDALEGRVNGQKTGPEKIGLVRALVGGEDLKRYEALPNGVYFDEETRDYMVKRGGYFYRLYFPADLQLVADAADRDLIELPIDIGLLDPSKSYDLGSFFDGTKIRIIEVRLAPGADGQLERIDDGRERVLREFADINALVQALKQDDLSSGVNTGIKVRILNITYTGEDAIAVVLTNGTKGKIDILSRSRVDSWNPRKGKLLYSSLFTLGRDVQFPDSDGMVREFPGLETLLEALKGDTLSSGQYTGVRIDIGDEIPISSILDVNRLPSEVKSDLDRILLEILRQKDPNITSVDYSTLMLEPITVETDTGDKKISYRLNGKDIISIKYDGDRVLGININVKFSQRTDNPFEAPYPEKSYLLTDEANGYQVMATYQPGAAEANAKKNIFQRFFDWIAGVVRSLLGRGAAAPAGGTTAQTRASEVFNEDYEQEYRKLTRERLGEERDLWADLAGVGIDRNTLLVTVTETPRMKTGGNGNVVYTPLEDKPNTIYFLPDDFRGREIVKKYSNGDTIVDMWWLEGADVTVHNKGEATEVSIPRGVIPGYFVMEQDGTSGEFVIYQGEPADAAFQGLGAKEYVVINGRLKANVIYSGGGKLIGERYSYPVAAPMREALGIATLEGEGLLGVAVLGTETIYYDVAAPHAKPVKAVLALDNDLARKLIPGLTYNVREWKETGGEVRLAIASGSAQRLFATVREQVREWRDDGRGNTYITLDSQLAREVFPDVPANVEFRVEGANVYFTTKDEYELNFSVTEDKEQKVSVRTIESEGLDARVKFLQESSFVDGKLVTKTRPSVIEEWFEKAGGVARTMAVVGGVYLSLLALGGSLGELFGVKSRKKKEAERKKKEAAEASGAPSAEEDLLPPEERQGAIEKALKEIDDFSNYGLPQTLGAGVKDRVAIVKERLKAQIKAELMRGNRVDTVKVEGKIVIGVAEKYFQDYRKGWLLPVMGEEPGDFTLEDMYLYNLVTAASANYEYTGPNVKHYLFYRARQMAAGMKAESNEEKLKKKKKEIGQYIQNEVTLWVGVLTANDQLNNPVLKTAVDAKKVDGMKDRLIMDDIEDYFRSKDFIAWYETREVTTADNAFLETWTKLIAGLEKKGVPESVLVRLKVDLKKKAEDGEKDLVDLLKAQEILTALLDEFDEAPKEKKNPDTQNTLTTCLKEVNGLIRMNRKEIEDYVARKYKGVLEKKDRTGWVRDLLKAGASGADFGNLRNELEKDAVADLDKVEQLLRALSEAPQLLKRLRTEVDKRTDTVLDNRVLEQWIRELEDAGVSGNEFYNLKKELDEGWLDLDSVEQLLYKLAQSEAGKTPAASKILRRQFEEAAKYQNAFLGRKLLGQWIQELQNAGVSVKEFNELKKDSDDKNTPVDRAKVVQLLDELVKAHPEQKGAVTRLLSSQLKQVDKLKYTFLTSSLQKTYPDVMGGWAGFKGVIQLLRNYFWVFTVLAGVSVVPAFMLFAPLGMMGAYALGLAGFTAFHVGMYFGLNYLIDKRLQNKINTGRWKPAPIEKEYVADADKGDFWTSRKGRNIKAGIMMAVTLAEKALWNALVWKLVAVPLTWLWFSTLSLFGLSIGGWVLVGVALVPFVFFFMVDIFAFFYFNQAVLGFVLGKISGATSIHKWKKGTLGKVTGKSIEADFEPAMKHFRNKILPLTVTGDKGKQRPITEVEKQIASAKSWNLIIRQFRKDDLIGDEELARYSYKQGGVILDPDLISGGVNFISGDPDSLQKPDFSIPPKNLRVQKRLEHYLSTLFMEMERMPTWDQMYMFSVMNPCYDEVIMYPFNNQVIDPGAPDLEALNISDEATGSTLLTYIINLKPDEWQNFIARFRREGKYPAAYIEKLEQLKYGEPLSFSDDGNKKWKKEAELNRMLVDLQNTKDVDLKAEKESANGPLETLKADLAKLKLLGEFDFTVLNAEKKKLDEQLKKLRDALDALKSAKKAEQQKLQGELNEINKRMKEYQVVDGDQKRKGDLEKELKTLAADIEKIDAIKRRLAILNELWKINDRIKHNKADAEEKRRKAGLEADKEKQEALKEEIGKLDKAIAKDEARKAYLEAEKGPKEAREALKAEIAELDKTLRL